MKTAIFFVQANVGAIRKVKVVHDHKQLSTKEGLGGTVGNVLLGTIASSFTFFSLMSVGKQMDLSYLLVKDSRQGIKTVMSWTHFKDQRNYYLY